MNKILIVSLIIGLLIFLIGVVLEWAIIPIIVKNEIIKNVELREYTDQFDRFKKLPIPFEFKVYLFNVTNSENYLYKNETPIIEEVGPYIYSEYRQKNIIEHEEKMISYTEQQTFHFEKDKSGYASENDVIIVVDPALNGAAQMLTRNDLTKLIFDKYYEETFMINDDRSVFIKTTVKNFLFDGYDICVKKYNILCLILTLKTSDSLRNMRILLNGGLRFSFFNHKNITHDGHYMIHDGVSSIENLGLIKKWQNNEYLQRMWKGEHSKCNKITGRDSVIYPPYLNDETEIVIFNTDICRTVNLYYTDELSYKDVTTKRYLMSKDTLDTTLVDNKCYCINKTQESIDICDHSGVIDLTNCYGAPILLSWPHFLWADDIYKEEVNGTNSNEDFHTTYVDIEPNTGTPIQGFRRVQFNMFAQRQLTLNTSAHNSMIPILWIDENVKISDDLYNFLKESFVDKKNLGTYVSIGILVVGVLICIISIGFFFWKKRTTDKIM